MKDKEFNVYGEKYTLYTRTGEVLKSSKFSTTHVSGGGSTSNGSVSISSSSTIHDQVFIVDKNNQEHNIRLSNWDINVREGHTLTFCWIIKNGKETGKYVSVFNRTTNENLYNNDILKKMFLPPFRRLLGLLLFTGIFYYFYKSSNFNSEGLEILSLWFIYFPISVVVLIVIYYVSTRQISKIQMKKIKEEYLYSIQKTNQQNKDGKN
jgi:hypothetical protein